jgi:hypothetical protein
MGADYRRENFIKIARRILQNRHFPAAAHNPLSSELLSVIQPEEDRLEKDEQNGDTVYLPALLAEFLECSSR